jgi:DNA-damage-inducible protein J
MKTANYNVRLNPEIKTEAEKTFALFGMNLSEAINIFLHKSIIENGLPFAVTAPKYRPEVYELIERIESGEEKLISYPSTDALFADLHSGDDDE